MWQGNGEVLMEITNLISDAVCNASNTRQQEIASKISELTESPDFPCYLITILTTPSLSPTIRLASGHTLKSVLEKRRDLPASTFRFLQEVILRSLPDDSISSALCSIAATLYIIIEGWPELLHYLSEHLPSQTALALLALLFEDISTYSALAYLLDTPQYSEILRTLVLQLLDLAAANNLYAIKVLNQLLKIMPTGLMSLVGRYLEILISSPPSELVAEGIFTLTCSRKDIVKRYFPQCAEIMIVYMASDKGAVACNFWMEFIGEPGLVLPFLQKLLFAVLGSLRLTENDIMLIMPDTEDFRFEKEDKDKNWSKRREAAILLDNLGQTFAGQCFLILQETIQGLLLSPDWVSVESGLLALGALAPGASEALVPSLPTFLPFLLQQTTHVEKLVVAMALWTISRLTDFIINTQYFQGYLEAIVNSMRTQANIVQQAACTAFCILIGRNPEQLHDFLDQILQIFGQCLEYYRGKALVNLLDAVCSVGDILGESLKEPKYLPLLFAPILALWNRTKSTERLMWTLCESLTSVILALGPLVEPYTQVLLNRCCELIIQGLNGPERQFAIKALELAGVLVEVSESLVIGDLLPLLLQCLDDRDLSMKQYAAATAGDLIFKRAAGVENCVPLLISSLANCLCVIEGPGDISSLFSLASNNAACALSEIAVVYPRSLEAHVPELLRSILDCSGKTLIPQVKANFICCAGKLGNSSAEALAKELLPVLSSWSEMINHPLDPKDKEACFTGVALALTLNISALDHTFQHFAKSLVDYTDMPGNLNTLIRQVLGQVKALAGEQWENYVAQLTFRSQLLARFQV